MNWTGLIILLAILAAPFVWAVSIYNGLVALRNRFKNGFAQIDVQLKRRYDLIPNLVETAKGYMAHERQTLEAVIAARNTAVGANQRAAANPADGAAIQGLAAAEAGLSGALGRLFALSEAYPDLKANQNMMQLSEELTSTENKIAFARQAKHGEQKIIAVRAVNPTGAKSEEAAAGLLNRLLAGQLAFAVNIQRVRFIGLNPWLLLLPVEHIVSGIVNQQCIETASLFSEHAGSSSVDRHGHVGLGFGPIDGCIGCRIQNHLGLDAANQRAGLPLIGKIDGFEIDGDNGTEACKAALEFQAYLSGSADDENARLFCHVG